MPLTNVSLLKGSRTATQKSAILDEIYQAMRETFGVPQDEDAVAAIDALFPDRSAIGLPMRAVLAGGGGFHCASMQMPSPPTR